MTKEEKQKERLKKIIKVFTYMVEHNLTQNETAAIFHVDRGTMVKWKKELKSKDIKLYQQVQEICDNNNTKLFVPDVQKRTCDIAEIIIKYEFTVPQAITYCGYEVSRSRVTHDFKKYLDEDIYHAVKKVLAKFENRGVNKEQKERFEHLLNQKKSKDYKQHDIHMNSRKSITDTEKEKIAVECVKYIVEYEVSLLQTAKKFNIAKTTMVNWINKFVPNKFSDLYQEYLKVMENQNKQVMSEYKRRKQEKDTLLLAYFILEHPELPLNKIVEQLSPYISRTQAIRYVYHDLYELDTTPNKNLYLTVMRQIAKFDRRGIEYSQSKQIIQAVEDEVKKKNSSTVIPRDIEKKILRASERLLNGEKSAAIAQDMNINEADMMSSMEEVLPFINNQMYKLLEIKTNLVDSEDKQTLKLTK